MKLYLIRHAQSANNALLSEKRTEFGRDSDPEITEIGHEQARLVAAHMARADAEPRQISATRSQGDQIGLTHLYCSLMTRSILTAEYIADALSLPLVALPDVFERGGIYDLAEDGTCTGLPGRGRSYFTERFPNLALPDGIDESGWYQRPYETVEPFLERIDGALAALEARHGGTDDVVGMVLHGDVIDQCVNVLMNVPRPDNYYESVWDANWVFHNTSLTRIDFSAESRAVVYTNRIDHLSAELVTW